MFEEDITVSEEDVTVVHYQSGVIEWVVSYQSYWLFISITSLTLV
jgi:hypothetical protein